MSSKHRKKALSVWINGERVGTWSQSRTGRHEFRYASSWISSPHARPISLSLPLAGHNHVYSGNHVANYFDNLLPDSDDIRRRIQQRFSIRSRNIIDLLTNIGRDCVGAIQLLPDEISPKDIHTIQATPLTESDIEEIIRSVPTPLFPKSFESNHFRISVAGAQEKTALLYHNREWNLPGGTTPTTHIFKLPLGKVMGIDMSTSIENEWLCGKIMEKYGFPIAHSDIQTFGDQKVLIVERFDRTLSKDRSWIIRMPTEDICQATARSPEEKYENEGGPGIKEIMDLLLGSKNSRGDRKQFMKIQLLFWMLAAPDGHGKNFSLFLRPGGAFHLTPIYDVISAWPIMGEKPDDIHPSKLKMAMAVSGKNRHYNWMQITKRHWYHTASRCGIKNQIETIINEIVTKTPDVIHTVSNMLPENFPAKVSGPIFDGLDKSSQSLKS